jgi:hypothetical protein
MVRQVNVLTLHALVRFQVLTTTSINMAVFWDVEPCRLVEIGRRFRGADCLHRQGYES